MKRSITALIAPVMDRSIDAVASLDRWKRGLARAGRWVGDVRVTNWCHRSSVGGWCERNGATLVPYRVVKGDDDNMHRRILTGATDVLMADRYDLGRRVIGMCSSMGRSIRVFRLTGPDVISYVGTFGRMPTHSDPKEIRHPYSPLWLA